MTREEMRQIREAKKSQKQKEREEKKISKQKEKAWNKMVDRLKACGAWIETNS